MHKSHSAAFQDDYDGAGKATGYKRETAGMGVDIDDNALHRNYYYQQPIDVIKELQEQQEARKPGIFDVLGLGAYARHVLQQELYDNFRFRVATPRELKD